MRISPRRTASAMTRPVIALVMDPTSIGVVSSAPMPASRTCWVASRSTSATATAWKPASQPMLAWWSRCARTVGSPLRAGCQVRGQHPGRDRDGDGADEHGEEKATCDEVAPGQDDEHEQCLPAVVGVPAVPAAAQREHHHRGRDEDQDRGDEQLPGPAACERGRVAGQQPPQRSAATSVWNTVTMSTASRTKPMNPSSSTQPSTSQRAPRPPPATTVTVPARIGHGWPEPVAGGARGAAVAGEGSGWGTSAAPLCVVGAHELAGLGGRLRRGSRRRRGVAGRTRGTAAPSGRQPDRGVSPRRVSARSMPAVAPAEVSTFPARTTRWSL